MSSSDSASTKPSGAGRKPKLRRWIIILGGALTTLLLLVVIRLQGRVSGREFSPTHFQIRQFSFYEIPLLHIQITPIKRTGVTPAAANFIRRTSLIPNPPKGPPQTWHLVTISRGISGTTPADAKLLCDQLSLQANGGDYWQTWSQAHKQRAKVLWPIVQRLAERELYILVPGLLELAMVDQPATQFSQQADQWLRNEYAHLIQDMRDAERTTLANELLDEALQDFPDDVELTKLKDQPPQPEDTGSPTTSS